MYKSILLSFFLFFAVGCSSDNTDSLERFEDTSLAPTIIHNFAHDVIIPTYALLNERGIHLVDATLELKNNPSETTLAAAQQAWVLMREPWEQSEGFLFGPVDAYGIDPALDSWPVNRIDLDNRLNDEKQLTEDYVATLDPTLQGFHTAEYLLFGTNSNKSADQITSDELDYLVAVASIMAKHATLLETGWTVGIDEDQAYVDIFTSAGDVNNRIYPSYQSAGQEIVQGVIGILDEVANGKIADPLNEQDTRLVESQFSFNSLNDFIDNIRSVQNAYCGYRVGCDKNESDCNHCSDTLDNQSWTCATDNSDSVGLSTYIDDIDPELNTAIETQIMASIQSLCAIPAPFRDSVLDEQKNDSIETAQQAIQTLKQTFELSILPLVIN